MTFKKYLFASFLLLMNLSAFSQNNDAVFLKWKLKPNETISYKTAMEEIDTANHKDFDVSGLSKLMSGDSDTGVNETFKRLSRMMDNASFITHVKENRNKIIDITLLMSKGKPAEDTSKMDAQSRQMEAMMLKATSGVMLRGAITEEGRIESFYTKGDQKNLIAMLFELPGKPVKVGDSWPLTVSLISMDQNFVCDSSYHRNIVTVTDIKDIGNDRIVTLKYDIIEYVNGDFSSPFNNSSVKTSMKMTHRAIAHFSVEKGRWLDYNGIMSLSASGFMTSQTTKRLSLVEE